ncbi:hypothetical protein BCR33DRAFT_846888 [Rhizoclosmatium globosum]|uniref:Uncharacterized protein n=1 Tax=Rhizoclosmatium globosum TaxID=329046 RepID=A0A1Y2CTL9_9FUNG|nr:hypothetical protein BCR33DRAFT_846888 [Rhizoclosmatium globosum]|eukprot:ORY50400.1 hypothetical protein BCR33DRAFT_846888 [Rhizoclosmatium globosum]
MGSERDGERGKRGGRGGGRGGGRRGDRQDSYVDPNEPPVEHIKATDKGWQPESVSKKKVVYDTEEAAEEAHELEFDSISGHFLELPITTPSLLKKVIALISTKLWMSTISKTCTEDCVSVSAMSFHLRFMDKCRSSNRLRMDEEDNEVLPPTSSLLEQVSGGVRITTSAELRSVSSRLINIVSRLTKGITVNFLLILKSYERFIDMIIA